MSQSEPFAVDQVDALLALYPRAVGEVYGYLLPRSGTRSAAEDLTSETFLAAIDTLQRRTIEAVTTAWLIGIARHKLADHWRRAERDERRLRVLAQHADDADDPWEAAIDAAVARAALKELGAHHRAALTFRYLDGLPVREVAGLLERTEHATEALLVRARKAFRAAYDDADGPDSNDASQKERGRP
ncbi:MAG TPA: RNA polymerase sigma factor [Microthrixaceae bacterium]|nr:RNA polymerase sigma factor [Microthrixaceae bacterium]